VALEFPNQSEAELNTNIISQMAEGDYMSSTATKCHADGKGAWVHYFRR